MLHNMPYSLDELKQHEKLTILISTQDAGVLTDELKERFRHPHRKTHYFFQFLLQGDSTHVVDLQKIILQPQQLLFVLPHQIHQLPPAGHGTPGTMRYFKLGFDQHCLSLLPQAFPFLVNPLQQQQITFTPAAAERLEWIFKMLAQHLSVKDTPARLVLTHLDTLLTEINHAYFAQQPEQGIIDDKLKKYIDFKLLVEKDLPEQPAVATIARQLGINTTALYNIVTRYAGVSPKTFVNNRLILEAQRKLYYAERSVKEIAFDLGFNDPDYFSRLFRKVTGKTVSAFAAEMKDLSGS
jgi:AraC family transcriptional regulator, transcriptional activator of pobA